MAPATSSAPAPAAKSHGMGPKFTDKEKPASVRTSNICAAKSVADAVRTSLGPRGMDKMIQAADGEVTITNDGATILKQMSVVHPTARMLVELSKAQDIEAGDGTTSVVVMAGALLDAAEKMLNIGIHPTTISDAFQRAAVEAMKILEDMSTPVDLENDEELIKLASTSLNSKVVSQHSWLLAPMAVKAVKRIIDAETPDNVNLNMIKLVKKLGETVEESELIDGALIEQKSMGHGGPTRIEKAKIGLIQFQISPPKTDIENQVIITDYTQMDRALREERQYLLELCKQIKKAGCNVLLIQKSILRDAVTEKALHFFAKMKIMVVKDIEREDIEFYSKILGCRPVASADHFIPEALGSADLVEEIRTSSDEAVIKVTGLQNAGQAVSIEQLKIKLLERTRRRREKIEKRLKALNEKNFKEKSSCSRKCQVVGVKKNGELQAELLRKQLQRAQKRARRTFNFRHLKGVLPTPDLIVNDVMEEMERFQRYRRQDPVAKVTEEEKVDPMARVEVSEDGKTLSCKRKNDVEETFTVGEAVMLTSQLTEEDFLGFISAITSGEVKLMLVCGTHATVALDRLRSGQCALHKQPNERREGEDQKSVRSDVAISLEGLLRDPPDVRRQAAAAMNRLKRKTTVDIRRGF